MKNVQVLILIIFLLVQSCHSSQYIPLEGDSTVNSTTQQEIEAKKSNDSPKNPLKTSLKTRSRSLRKSSLSINSSEHSSEKLLEVNDSNEENGPSVEKVLPIQKTKELLNDLDPSSLPFILPLLTALESELSDESILKTLRDGSKDHEQELTASLKKLSKGGLHTKNGVVKRYKKDGVHITTYKDGKSNYVQAVKELRNREDKLIGTVTESYLLISR